MKRMKGNLFSSSLLMLGLTHSALIYAGEFYTIIGPDGRPMVIQQKGPSSKATSAELPKPMISAIPSSVQRIQTPELSTQPHISTPEPFVVVDKKLTPSVKIAVEHNARKAKLPTSSAGVVGDKKPTVQSSVIQSQPEAVTPKAVHTLVSKPSKQSENLENFVVIDGEKYIKNEYLEDREFNLDGKKRFYAMPEGIIDKKNGATRLQLIEREKGVSQSVLQSFFKRNQHIDTGPIVLASTYYRISQAEAIQSLGQSCIANKKMKQIKTLNQGKEVNLWPRAPLKDQFDFEVVQLGQSIQNIQIHSYASKQDTATFYWPFIVFLDHQGCVLEGAGGFKNQQSAASFAAHENIEGIIHIPLHSHYILFTPLASAIDVEDKALSNQGQLKLIAIR